MVCVPFPVMGGKHGIGIPILLLNDGAIVSPKLVRIGTEATISATFAGGGSWVVKMLHESMDD